MTIHTIKNKDEIIAAGIIFTQKELPILRHLGNYNGVISRHTDSECENISNTELKDFLNDFYVAFQTCIAKTNKEKLHD